MKPDSFSHLRHPSLPIQAPCGGRTAVVLALLTIIASGCSEPIGPGADSSPSTIHELPRPLSGPEVAAISANNEFGFDLMREVASADPSADVFLSPLSASMALAMTMNGAAGGTFDAIRGSLRFGAVSEPEINSAYRGLLDLLTGLDGDVDLAIGNAIWYRDNLTARTDFRRGWKLPSARGCRGSISAHPAQRESSMIGQANRPAAESKRWSSRRFLETFSPT